jgi:hypothetical protein
MRMNLYVCGGGGHTDRSSLGGAIGSKPQGEGIHHVVSLEYLAEFEATFFNRFKV